MIARPVPDDTLAGYRLVRKLAVGSRADVYLGVGSTGAVALKVFGSLTPRASVEAELDALGRLDSPHVVALIDIASGSGDLPVLVLERIAQGSLASLLAERIEVECGEAVTLLAPLAAVVAQLHDAGVAHGRISATSVHLGAGRKPVLLGFGHCVLFPPGGTMAAIDKHPAAASDRDALATLALGVLACVGNDASASRVSDLTHWIESTPREYEFPRDLEERILACAEPLPIAELSAKHEASRVPARITQNRHPAPAHVAADSAADVAAHVAARSTAHSTAHSTADRTIDMSTDEPAQQIPRSVFGVVSSWLGQELLENPLDHLKQRTLALVKGVRPRFWVIAGAVAVAVAMATALLPSGGSAASRSPVPEPVATVVAAPTPTPLPDDPVLAARILLEARTTCIRNLSILCLDGVDEASSAAFASDAALIQQIEGGGEIPKTALATGAPTLVERMGDSVLIGLSTADGGGSAGSPVSILMIRGRTGWRIRDILNGLQATGSSPSPVSPTPNGAAATN